MSPPGLNAWRRLGDVLSCLLFLGYHQEIHASPETPPFLVELRKSAFARIYSDDKNIAVFLGRPPRLNRIFCFFQIPGGVPNFLQESTRFISPPADIRQGPFNVDEQINSTTEIRWSALCAFLKEEVLELFQNADKMDTEHGQKIAYVFFVFWITPRKL